MPAQPRPYHHGDLRRALVDGAISLLRESGAGSLTLRAAARRAGVSASAPYRHFADHRELLAAIATDGFARLRAAMLDAANQATQANTALRDVARAYVRFGVTHPAEYRIMFSGDIAGRGTFGDLDDASALVLSLFEGTFFVLQQRQLAQEGDVSTFALVTWSSMHGLTMLMLDERGAFGADSGNLALEDIEARVDTTINLLLFGIAKRET
jgi:AcrR family transcriptional regulator